MSLGIGKYPQNLHHNQDIQMSNKLIEMNPKSLIIGEMQIKTQNTAKHTLEWQKIKDNDKKLG